MSNAFKSKKFLKIKKILEKYLFRDLRVPDSMFNPSPNEPGEGFFVSCVLLGIVEWYCVLLHDGMFWLLCDY